MRVAPKVILLGAGPGDPDLITLKGVKALQWANVILYDALVDENVLKHASASTKCICVGKRSGKHSYSQDAINDLLVECAFKYKKVVRLKGGDPFVFGRGMEEIKALSNVGVETEVIPGLSSSIAVPTAAKISLTQRGIAESFWVVTATTSSRKLSKDIYLAAQSTSTIVILMGLSKLNDIVDVYKQFGKDDLPAMIIQNGTWRNEKGVIAPLNDLSDKAKQAGVSSPAIIIIGEVLSEELQGQLVNEINDFQHLIPA